MPTHRDRIAVTKDPELAGALESVAALVPEGVKPATLVRDLAVRGADALLADARARRRGTRGLDRPQHRRRSRLRPGAAERHRPRGLEPRAVSAAAFGGGVLIADTSVWQRTTHPDLRVPWTAALRARTIATCSIITLELLYGTRTAAEFRAVEADLATLHDMPVTVSVQRAAIGASAPSPTSPRATTACRSPTRWSRPPRRRPVSASCTRPPLRPPRRRPGVRRAARPPPGTLRRGRQRAFAERVERRRSPAPHHRRTDPPPPPRRGGAPHPIPDHRRPP